MAANKIRLGLAPFATGEGVRSAWSSPAGSLLEWVGVPLGTAKAGVEWRANDPFRARLQISGIERGRSAARFIWVDDDDRRFPMFMTDMENLVRHGVEVGGIVVGWWMVRQMGQNFGLARIEDQ